MNKDVVIYLIFFICSAKIFSFDINYINNTPIANDQIVVVTEQKPAIITLVATDADDDTLVYSIVSQPSNGEAVLNGNEVTYTSNSDTETSDSFTFKVNDGTVDSLVATVSITITPINDSPIADAQVDIPAIENTEKTITLSGSDPEGDTLNYILVTTPSNGRLLDPLDDKNTIFEGTISSNSVIYLSSSDSATSDSFVFKVYDGNSESENATVTISITPVNDPPVAISKAVTVTEKVPTIINLTASDPDGTTPTVFKIVSLTNGELKDPENNNQLITAGTTIAGSTVTFTSKDSANADSFTFSTNDGLLDSNEGTISINIITDAPTANPQNVSVTEQTDKTITLVGSDAEGDALTYIISSLPSNGTLTDDGTLINIDDLPKTIKNTDVVYKSTSDSATSDSFTFKVNDAISDSSPASITISITPVNDIPIATPQTDVSTTEQVAATITLSGTDADGDTLTYAIVDSPSNGNTTLDGATVTYTSTSDTATSDSFTFKVNDGTVDSAKATISINITAVNDPPVANSQNLTVIEDKTLEIILSGSDPDEDALTFLIVASPIKGTANLDGDKVTYIPNLGYYGSDSIIFRVNDGTVLSSAGFIQITITSNDLDEDGILNDDDKCPNTPAGTIVDVKGCPVFTLPVNNNKVLVSSATCIGTSDGSLEISIEDNSFDYTVNIVGNNFGISKLIIGENKTASVTGLAKGTYTVCFKVDGQANYEQCFEVVIGEPKALSAFIDVDNDKRTTSIDLSGSKTYNIDINGQRHLVKGDNFTTTLPTGLSIIKISTNLDCQGVIEREIFISEDIHYYPNPTDQDVSVHVSGQDTTVQVSVFSEKGDLIYTQRQQIQDFSRKTKIDLSRQITGTYIVVMDGKTVRKTFKIVRR